jgi:hypothetical protein
MVVVLYNVRLWQVFSNVNDGYAKLFWETWIKKWCRFCNVTSCSFDICTLTQYLPLLYISFQRMNNAAIDRRQYTGSFLNACFSCICCMFLCLCLDLRVFFFLYWTIVLALISNTYFMVKIYSFIAWKLLFVENTFNVQLINVHLRLMSSSKSTPIP